MILYSGGRPDPFTVEGDPGVGRGGVGVAATLSEGGDTSQLAVAHTWATRVTLQWEMFGYIDTLSKGLVLGSRELRFNVSTLFGY